MAEQDEDPGSGSFAEDRQDSVGNLKEILILILMYDDERSDNIRKVCNTVDVNVDGR